MPYILVRMAGPRPPQISSPYSSSAKSLSSSSSSGNASSRTRESGSGRCISPTVVNTPSAHAGVDLAVGKGMLIIVFFEWCSLQSITFSIQVCMFISSACAVLPTRPALAILTSETTKGLSPILRMVRLLPMFVVSVLCNVVIALVIGRVA